MANQFISLPAPAGNGAGAAVDVSSFGAEKTVVVEGNGSVFEPTVFIEVSNDAAGTNWSPLWTFYQPNEKVFAVSVRWMRARVANYKGGGAPTVGVGGDDSGTTLAQLTVPSGNGVAAGVDTSSLPNYKTIQVQQPFRGNINIEISQDGGATYSQIASFYQPGIQSLSFTADFMRVSRNGVPVVQPGSPEVYVGACSQGGGGGSGGVGPGTTNTIAKFTAATTIGNSQITDDGTDVTVGVFGGGFLVIAAADILLSTTAVSPSGITIQTFTGSVSIFGAEVDIGSDSDISLAANNVGGVIDLSSLALIDLDSAEIDIHAGTGNPVSRLNFTQAASQTSMLQLCDGVSAAVSAANTGRLRYNATSDRFQISENGGAYQDLVPGNVQRFSYTVTGGEADPDDLVISLPAVRANTSYRVFPSLQQCTNILATAIPTAGKATNQFVLSLSGPSTAGDIFSFIVIDET